MKALALVSGGLDSILAAKVIQQEGLEVIPINFKIPFCHRKSTLVTALAANLQAEVKNITLGDEFLEIIRNPAHGFGSNMNPCIDCKILMLSKAKDLMRQTGAAFIITGEVVGQRPMSQYKQALALIAKQAGVEGLVLRPLSARLLPETIPEKNGWVQRDRLLSFSGRGRKPQMALADKFGMGKRPQPAGGCLLTDPEFTDRLKELILHDGLNMDNIELLKLGRHFRIADKTRLVVGRNEEENKELESLAGEGDYLFMPTDELAGPTCLGRGPFNEELIRLSCAIACRYCDHSTRVGADIIYKIASGNNEQVMRVAPFDEAKLTALRI